MKNTDVNQFDLSLEPISEYHLKYNPIYLWVESHTIYSMQLFLARSLGISTIQDHV